MSQAYFLIPYLRSSKMTDVQTYEVGVKPAAVNMGPGNDGHLLIDHFCEKHGRCLNVKIPIFVLWRHLINYCTQTNEIQYSIRSWT
jgi:hypothetical protein